MPATWFVRGNGQVYGPLDDKRLMGLAADGKIDGSTEVAKHATGPWYPASKVKGLKFADPVPKVALSTPRDDSLTEPSAPASSLGGVHSSRNATGLLGCFVLMLLGAVALLR